MDEALEERISSRWLVACSYLCFHFDACLLVHIFGFIFMPACLYLGFHFDACLSACLFISVLSF